MTGERRAVLDFIQNLAVKLKKVYDENVNNNLPNNEMWYALGIKKMYAVFLTYTTINLGFTEEQVFAKTNEKSMKLKFEMTDYEVNVLKKALESYPKNKDITNDLLGIIKTQCENQKEKENNND